MKTILQVLFGLALGVAGIVALFWLGLLVNGQPNWRTAGLVLLLLAVTQWISSFSFRNGIALQILSGLVLCIAVAVGLVYSNRSFFWEARYPDGSNPITWRSWVMFTMLLAITQGASFLIFRWFRTGGERLPKSGDITHNPRA